VPAFFDHLPQRPLDLTKRSGERRASRIKNHIPSRAELGTVLTEGLAQTALDSIADDRPAQRSRHRKSQPGSSFRIGSALQAERREHRAGYAGAVVIDRSKIGGAQNPRGSREGERIAAGGFRLLSQTGRLSRH